MGGVFKVKTGHLITVKHFLVDRHGYYDKLITEKRSDKKSKSSAMPESSQGTWRHTCDSDACYMDRNLPDYLKDPFISLNSGKYLESCELYRHIVLAIFNLTSPCTWTTEYSIWHSCTLTACHGARWWNVISELHPYWIAISTPIHGLRGIVDQYRKRPSFSSWKPTRRSPVSICKRGIIIVKALGLKCKGHGPCVHQLHMSPCILLLISSACNSIYRLLALA